MTWTLTGFADEASPDFAEQMALLNDLGLRHLEFRSAWRTNVLDLGEAQLADATAMLRAAGVAVSSIGSPIGKITISRDLEPHLERMRHAARLANRFGARYVRVFSFFIDQGDDPDRHRDEVIRRMAAIARIAEEHDVVALHENEKHIFGDIPRRCVDIVESVGSDHLRLIMDPANFVQCDVHPFTDAYTAMRPHLEYVHVKDAEFGADVVLPAGEGDGEVREVVRALAADGFDGFFSLEPHLGQFDAFGGMCGPELWTVAHRAFTGLLAEEGIPFA
ncbi:MAG: sugar phosphate isomerase/epimerase [Acidimicrobiales bacterium]|nr:sugar phosphate isomerase/epimerase [Acidimicrobiales bacterium]MCB9395635.1 sugar phosphate isomerase/epimerase [Acidimicrobiaceae bacterium]